MKKKILVFTDLDGTLLDLNTYSFKESEEAVKTLKENGASVIFCSSKTLSEQSYFQSRLNLSDPIIVENGSAIIFPDKFNDFLIKQRSILLGNSSEEIRKLLRKLRDSNDFKFRMFSEISVKELSEITGLDEESTKRAQQRDYSETIIIENPKRDINIITAKLGENNFSIKHGGRYYTVSSNKSDKGFAIKTLIGIYAEQYKEIITIGIGDSQNDIPMLRVVDKPFLVQRPDNSWLDTSLTINLIKGVGPAGFNNMVKSILRTSL